MINPKNSALASMKTDAIPDVASAAHDPLAFSVEWQGATGPGAEDRLLDIYEYLLSDVMSDPGK